MRCFIAIDIEPQLREKIYEVQQRIQERALKLVEKENLHITLKFLGEVNEDKIPSIIERLQKVKEKKFEIELSGLGVFPNFNYLRVVWINVKSNGNLENLVKVISSWLTEFPSEFSPHLTIARVKFRPETLRENIMANKDVYIGKQTVNNFSLKKSVLTQKGPVYEDISIFELV